MLIRKAAADEMLTLWGYHDTELATPTARFFYSSISSGNADFWTIESDGELIGELYAFHELSDSDFADGSVTAYLCAFRVRQEFRGQGLGTQLMGTVLDDLKSQGFTRVTIGVDEERNERLYRRMGFDSVVKECCTDPCAMDDNMQPVKEDEPYLLLVRDL